MITDIGGVGGFSGLSHGFHRGSVTSSTRHVPPAILVSWS
jgi:hypothetical protein